MASISFAITPKIIKNPFCKICQKARMMALPANTKGGPKRLDTKSFGDHSVADRMVVKANVEEGVEVKQ